MNQSVCAIRMLLDEDFVRREQPLFWADTGHEPVPGPIEIPAAVTQFRDGHMHQRAPINVCKWCGCLYAEVD